MWLAIYPNMDKENFINFDDYKAKLMPVKTVNIKDEDILNDVLEIRKKLERGGQISGNI